MEYIPFIPLPVLLLATYPILTSSFTYQVRLEAIYYIKSALSLTLSALSTASFVILLLNQEFNLRAVTQIIEIISFILACYVMHYQHSHSRTTSTLLVLYWGTQAITYGFALYNNHDITPLNIILAVKIVLSTITFFLENVAKKQSEYRSLNEDLKVTPELYANLYSKISFNWLSDMMKLGSTKVLTLDDMWHLKPQDTANYQSARFQKYLSAELSKPSPSLLRALFYAYWRTLLRSASFKAVQDVLQFTQPQLLHMIMMFAATYAPESSVEPQPFKYGFSIAFLMFLTGLTQTVFLHQYFQICFVMGMGVRSSIVTAVYNKSLRLSNGARQKKTVGEITNLMSVDTSRIADFCGYLHVLWSGPLQITIAIYFLYQTLGSSVFGGISVMLVMIPINGLLARRSRMLNKKQMVNKDGRTKMMDEILSGMKVIKLYAWEKPFYEKVQQIRNLELATLKSIAKLQAGASFTWSITPFLVAFVTFATFSVISDEPLTSTRVFVSLSLFNLLGFPLAVFPSMITSAVECSVSFNRLMDFFTSEEQDPENVIRRQFDGVLRVDIKDASFSWAPPDVQSSIVIGENEPLLSQLDIQEEVLSGINLEVKDQTLVSIIGTVGSGKSSLISAILGDLYKKDGSVSVSGSVAYIPQTAWILNATVRENILFGRTYVKEKYDDAVRVCGLTQDLESLVLGDMTEVGERGIAVSGGQKQRISIARAVYSDSDIYLFDDCLSAVDAHVGRYIFDNVIGSKGVLSKKTRLLVTHGIQYIPQSDQIIMLSSTGTSGMGSRVVEKGTYEELMKRKGQTYELIRDYGKKVNESIEDLSAELGAKKASEDIKAGKITMKGDAVMAPGGIGREETSKQGKVDWNVYKSYAESCSISYVCVFLLIAIGTQCLSISQNVLLSKWAQSNDSGGNTSALPWLVAYGVLGLSSSFCLVFQVLFAWVYCGIKSAKELHTKLLKNILKLPQSFFDVTPLGRVMNRFSKDMNTIDETLPRTFLGFFRTMLTVLSVLGVNSLGNPYYILFCLPLIYIYQYFQRYYLSTSRELKRLDSTTRSPIYSTFQETLYGVTSIRAYGLQSSFIRQMEFKVDQNQRSYYPSVSSNRWLAVRLEFIGALIVLGSATFGITALYFNRNTSSAVIGLMLVYALSVTQTLNWMVRQSCEIETNIVSVERIKEYTELTPEAAHYIPNVVPNQWPHEGGIIFKDVSVRYRDDLPLVVKGLSFEIKGREKIGVVGRTGAGKSSLTMALFRMIEAETGAIIIDGVDIATIGLNDLRSKLSIVPQDALLFAGTIRHNLDPFDSMSDADIWFALERANLKQFISSLPDNINHLVHQGGENFSVGQKSLICLARAMLRKPSVLILDEASASLDVKSDSIIQESIRDDFKDCTIITIAHRIGTIMQYDKVMVLDMGEIVEFDTPKKLLEKKGAFYKLARKEGLA